MLYLNLCSVTGRRQQHGPQHGYDSCRPHAPHHEFIQHGTNAALRSPASLYDQCLRNGRVHDRVGVEHVVYI
jgi:hypothetical protein